MSLATILDKEFNSRGPVRGLDNVFEKIFDEILLSRFYLKLIFGDTGLTKHRGFLLHEPLDTGKTLIARTITSILRVKPKIMSAPELLTCMLEELETEIRATFHKAHTDKIKCGS